MKNNARLETTPILLGKFSYYKIKKYYNHFEVHQHIFIAPESAGSQSSSLTVS